MLNTYASSTLLALFAATTAYGTGIEDDLCGPQSVAFVSAHLGVSGEPTEILEATGYRPGRGTSLAGLGKHFRQQNVYCTFVELSIGQLESLISEETAAIIALPGHFIAAVHHSEGPLAVDIGAGRLEKLANLGEDDMYPMAVLSLSDHVDRALNAPHEQRRAQQEKRRAVVAAGLFFTALLASLIVVGPKLGIFGSALR